MSTSVKSSRLRSLGGCLTCRRRHVKCDETRPSCRLCSHYGLACGGYKAKIAFDTDEADPETLRRPLYSTQEQKDMTVALLTSAPLKTLNKVLLRLDESVPTAEVISNGPFAVFQACEQPASQITPQSSSTVELVDETIPFDVLSDPAALASNEALDALFPDLFPSFDGEADTLTAPHSDLFEDLVNTTHFQFASTAVPLSEQQLLPLAVHVDQDWLSPSIPQVPRSESSLPLEATFLLNNFKDTVIAYLSPLYRRKTIWHVLYLPSAMASVAALTLGGDPNTAQLTIMYAMLSISANCLAEESESGVTEFWRVKGSEYKMKAQQSLIRTLRHLTQSCKRAKYKEVLMSLLVMSIVGVFAGDPSNAPLFLYDADKLIRLKGLRKKPRSRKVRMLHHHYSFLRMFYESMSQHVSSPADQQYRCTQPDVEDGIDLEARRDHPFRLAKWQLSLDKKMLEEKTLERGLDDLCLQEPGLWTDTMYPTFFGVPESWLILLSQSIRLGNERDIASSKCDDSALSWQEFSSRAQVLEKCISSWSPPEIKKAQDRDQDDPSESTHDPTADTIENMLSCLHSALRIYFYRRIYNVDATILQQQVSAVRQTLQQCDAYADKRLKHCAGFLWPALISACEAIDQDDQEFFLAWFAGLEKGKFINAQSALTVMNYVWQQRHDAEDNTFSWSQFLANHRMSFVFF